jgi:hypothetical protein
VPQQYPFAETATEIPLNASVLISDSFCSPQPPTIGLIGFSKTVVHRSIFRSSPLRTPALKVAMRSVGFAITHLLIVLNALKEV